MGSEMCIRDRRLLLHQWDNSVHEGMDITREWPRLQFYSKQIHANNENMQKLLCLFMANQSYRSTMSETTRSVKRKKTKLQTKESEKSMHVSSIVQHRKNLLRKKSERVDPLSRGAIQIGDWDCHRCCGASPNYAAGNIHTCCLGLSPLAWCIKCVAL